MDKEGNHLKNNVLRGICHNPAHPVCKQALFAIKRSLLCGVNKASLQSKEGLFEIHNYEFIIHNELGCAVLSSGTLDLL